MTKIASFAKLFDHSIVRPNATKEEIHRAADTAVSCAAATLTVQPHYIRLGLELLNGSGVLLGTVVGFPHGNETPNVKEYQAKSVLDAGAEEIDMVMNIPALKNREERVFISDIQGVVRAARGRVGQSDYRKLFAVAGRENPRLSVDRQDGCTLCENLNRLCGRRRNPGRRPTHARRGCRQMSGEGSRGDPRSWRNFGLFKGWSATVWLNSHRTICCVIPPALP